ncbi:hypothetical protein [Citrobacter portucalensis]|uniref:hypothetical protein n=1 Tax=Citrobacter portucalensis TaxID=1639133 RepID=UPI003BF4D9AB
MSLKLESAEVKIASGLTAMGRSLLTADLELSYLVRRVSEAEVLLFNFWYKTASYLVVQMFLTNDRI